MAEIVGPDDDLSAWDVIGAGAGFFLAGAALTALYYKVTESTPTIDLALNPAVAAPFGDTAEIRELTIMAIGKTALISTVNLISQKRGVYAGITFAKSLAAIKEKHGHKHASYVLAACAGCPSLATMTDLSESSLMAATKVTVETEEDKGDDAWDWLPGTGSGGAELYDLVTG